MSFPSLPAGPAWGRDRFRGNAGPARAARALPADERGWVPWTAAEREDFFDAIARHRRASWRITVACAFAIGVLALVIAVLLSPLLICLIGLAVDLVNLALPMPDVLGRFGNWIDPLFEEKTFGWRLLLQTTSVAAIPGLAVMAVAVLALNRALKRSPRGRGKRRCRRVV